MNDVNNDKLEAILQADPVDEGALVRVVGPIARGVIRGCGWQDYEDDLFQECAIAAIRCARGRRWDPSGGRAFSYFNRVFRNACLDYLKRESRYGGRYITGVDVERGEAEQGGGVMAGLTGARRDIARMIAEGLSVAQIRREARRLYGLQSGEADKEINSVKNEIRWRVLEAAIFRDEAVEAVVARFRDEVKGTPVEHLPDMIPPRALYMALVVLAGCSMTWPEWPLRAGL